MIYRLLAALLGLVALLTLILFVSVLIDYGDNIQVGRMIIVALVFFAAAFGAVKLWRPVAVEIGALRGFLTQ